MLYPPTTRMSSRFRRNSSIAMLELGLSACGLSTIDSKMESAPAGDPMVRFRVHVGHSELAASPSNRPKSDSLIQVVISWLGCNEPDGCRISAGGGEGGEPDDTEAATCIEACEDLPECDGFGDLLPSEEYGFGWMLCERYLECTQECGWDIGSVMILENNLIHRTYSQPILIHGRLPSELTIEIHEVPTTEALVDADGESVSLGIIVAEESPINTTSKAKGVAQSHVVLYTKNTISESSFLGVWLGFNAPLDSGFHVLDYAYVECPDQIFSILEHGNLARCGALLTVSPLDLDTPIEVHMGNRQSLEWPFFPNGIE